MYHRQTCQWYMPLIARLIEPTTNAMIYSWIIYSWIMKICSGKPLPGVWA